MEDYIFLYKENIDDRDCCAYIEPNPLRWECNHYFGSVNIHGPCYTDNNFAYYQDIETVLKRLELRSTNHSRAEQINDENERKRLLEEISLLCQSLVSDNTLSSVSDSCKEEDVLSEIVRRSQKQIG